MNAIAFASSSNGAAFAFSGLPGTAAQSRCLGCCSSNQNPMLGMMLQQQQTLLYMVGLMMGLMLGRQGLSGGNLNTGGTPNAGGSNGGGATGATGGNGADVPNGPANGKLGRFMEIAKAQQGDPYVFGATGPNAFDCSGLVYYALKEAGVAGPRLTARGYQQKYANSKVDRANLKPGDLIFYWSPNSRGIPPGQASHVEIYLGNGMAMGTDNPSEGARIEPVNWSTFIGGARVPELYA